MNYSEKYLQLMQADKNLYALLWNPNDGWKQLGKNTFLSIPDDLLAENGLECLLNHVADSDLELCVSFLKSIGTPPDTDNPVSRQTVALHLTSKDKEILYYKLECDCLWDNDKQQSILCQIRELSPEEIYQIQLSHTITNDKNPSYFANGVVDIMAQHPDWKFALIQFDISKFRIVNEQYGETFGNEVLQFIIHGLKMICKQNQLYARLSADLFMVFTPYETNDDIMALIHQIQYNLSAYKGVIYRLDFGVCPIYEKNQVGLVRLYGDNAAFARKSIKNDALNRVGFFSEKLKAVERTRKFIEDNMEDALRLGEFVMFLQPKYSISQNKMIGAEALVRWSNTERGLMQPMEFIPLFELNNFIIKVDYFIWEQACKTIRGWIDNGIEPIPISVNMSRKHLYNNDFISVLNHLIDKYQIDRKFLEIEITETAKGPDVTNGVTTLKDNGFTLLMDDFGSGYSTFSTLKDTKFDVLKIDREVLQNFIGSDRGEKIVEHIVHMTQSLGLDLIAEGVESQEQTVFLSKCGCDKVQGYFYAKPMTLEDFNKQMQ